MTALTKIEQDLGVNLLPDTKSHRYRMEVNSETSDNIYVVSQTVKSGLWMCSCFGFRRHRHCKHLRAIVPAFERLGIDSTPKPIPERTATKPKPPKKKSFLPPKDLRGFSWAIKQSMQGWNADQFKKSNGKRGNAKQWAEAAARIDFGPGNEILTVLGLKRKPQSLKSLRKAFEAKLMEHHPDKGGDPIMTQKVIEAFRILKKGL